MRTVLIFILTCFLTLIKSETQKDEDCITYLQSLTNYFLTNAPVIETMYSNSGKDYNDFGRFKACENTENYNYLLAQVVGATKLPIPMAIGLCMP